MDVHPPTCMANYVKSYENSVDLLFLVFSWLLSLSLLLGMYSNGMYNVYNVYLFVYTCHVCQHYIRGFAAALPRPLRHPASDARHSHRDTAGHQG